MRIACTGFLMVALLLTANAYSQDPDVLILQPDEEQEEKPVIPDEPVSRTRDVPESDVSDIMYLEFYDLWRQFELQLKLGSVDQKLIGELIRARNRNGIPKITEFAISAVRFGDARLDEGKPDEALQLFRAAASLDPTLSIAYYSQARAL